MIIEGIHDQIEEGSGGDYAGPYLHIRSEAPLRTFHTSVWRGGYGFHRHLVNRQVPLRYNCSDPAEEMGRFLREGGIPPEETCGMLTAAKVRDVGFSQDRMAWADGETGGELRIAAWVTAGLGNTARAGDTVPVEQLYPGTVNIIVLADCRLTDTAMAGAVITATEAKTAVFQDLGILVRATGRQATGTTTDAVLVAATGRGTREFAYAGGATVAGSLIGRAVYRAAYEACVRYLRKEPSFTSLSRIPDEDFPKPL